MVILKLLKKLIIITIIKILNTMMLVNITVGSKRGNIIKNARNNLDDKTQRFTKKLNIDVKIIQKRMEQLLLI